MLAEGKILERMIYCCWSALWQLIPEPAPYPNVRVLRYVRREA